ncbi:MAG: LPS export ABC transporter periplasmic protein LptC [Gemmatimonadaceae bacterium]|nr:LPS export ABC transporter periplasmic protein LptC [Gemmatimonadaceae bacterium]
MRSALLLAVAFAAILASCRSQSKTAIAKKAPSTADSADQMMWGMRLILTDRGVQRAELQADTGYFFDENTRAELRIVKTTFFNNQGARDGVLTSKRGTYNTRASVMEARDNVVIVGVDGKRLTSPMVRFEQFRNLIVSDSPFVFVDGQRRIEGIGFESDPQMLNVKVRQLSRGTGARIMLPSSKGSAPVFRTDSSAALPPTGTQPMTGPIRMPPAQPAAKPKPLTPIPPAAGTVPPGAEVKP